MLKKEKAQQERRLFQRIKKFKPSFQAQKGPVDNERQRLHNY